MPGHKGRVKSANKFNLYECDVTELPAIDNEKLVRQAESDCARILGASHVRFLTGGSSEGIFAMLYAVKHTGKKLAICRSAHKSVYNALKLFGIEPVILDGELFNGSITYPSVASVEKALSNKAVFGVLFTYPDYYGRYFDIKKLSATVKMHGKLLLVDGAHGSHYKFIGQPYAGEYADIWVDGSHKTMPTLNQGAMLCSNLPELNEKIDEGVDIFATTSPSYPILASIEYGVKYMAKKGMAVTDKFNDALDEFKIKLAKLGVPFLENTDVYKLALDFGSVGYDTYEIERALIGCGVHVELNDGRYILLMFSANSTKLDLIKAFYAIKKVLAHTKKTDVETQFELIKHKRKMPYLTAVSTEYELTEIKDAVGKISADNVGLFPPCYPVIVAGELITERCVELLAKKNTFGLIDGKIKTVKEK